MYKSGTSAITNQQRNVKKITTYTKSINIAILSKLYIYISQAIGKHSGKISYKYYSPNSKNIFEHYVSKGASLNSMHKMLREQIHAQ